MEKGEMLVEHERSIPQYEAELPEKRGFADQTAVVGALERQLEQKKDDVEATGTQPHGTL